MKWGRLPSPKGASHASPGQRPGSKPAHKVQALKGRHKHPRTTRRWRTMVSPLQGSGCIGSGGPRALPWAMAGAAPLGLRNTAITRLEREIALLREHRTWLVASVLMSRPDVRSADRQLPTESVGPEPAPDLEELAEVAPEEAAVAE